MSGTFAGKRPDKLADKRIVITGGTGFLGSAVVQTFLDAGATCDVTWLMEHELKHFTAHDRVKLHQVDCTNESQVEKFYASLDNLWASIHIVGGFAMAPIDKTSADDFRKMFDLNAMTCFLCCREAIKSMRKTKVAGRIVNVAARPALVPAGGMIAYTTSKAAVASITRCLAEELKPEGILINAIAPSIMDTAANRKAMPDADFANWPKVEEVASGIRFLASEKNALTSGEVVPVYGKA